MTSFSYDNSQSHRRFILRKFASIVILTAPFIADRFYDIEFVKAGYIYFVLGYIIATIISDLDKLQAYKIDFDDRDKHVRIYSKTVFGKPKSSELAFTDIKLKISSRKRKGKRKIYLIDFANNKDLVASIYDERHRFDSADLYYIYKTAETFNIETEVC